MKFSDLTFEAHPNGSGQQARHDFPNGYGVSVISGEFAYHSETCPYELAVFHEGSLCYTTPITNNVLGYQTEAGITTLLAEVEALPPLQENNNDPS